MAARIYPILTDPSNLKAGQRVQISCDRLKEIFRNNAGLFDGIVTEVFDSGHPLGIQVDVKNSSSWWRWIPSVDGGEARTES